MSSSTRSSHSSWDRVRVVTEFKPEASGAECPFDWNWFRGERDSLIASGLLTVLIFVHRAAIVNYLELRHDEVAFHGVDSSLSPATALFSVEADPDHAGGVKLTLKNLE